MGKANFKMSRISTEKMEESYVFNMPKFCFLVFYMSSQLQNYWPKNIGCTRKEAITKECRPQPLNVSKLCVMNCKYSIKLKQNKFIFFTE